jgi:hypothetical protein
MAAGFFLEHIWIIPLLPAFGAAMMLFFGRMASGIPARPNSPAPGHGHDDAHGVAVHHPEPSPAVTHHDPHAAHGPSDAHGPAAHVHERHEFVNVVCVGVVVLAFLWSVLAVWQYGSFASEHHGAPFEKVMFTWLGSDTGMLTIPGHNGQPIEFKAEAGFLLDPLSAVWLLFVTGVGKQLRHVVCWVGRRGLVLLPAHRFLFPAPFSYHRRE